MNEMLDITLQKIKLDGNENEGYYRTEITKGERRDHRISDERQLKGNGMKGERKFAVRRGVGKTITEDKGMKG